MNTRRLLDICKNLQQMSGSLLVFFHPCLVSVLFSAPSILSEIKFQRNFFPQFRSFHRFLRPPSKQMTKVFTVQQMNTLAQKEKCIFRYSAKCILSPIVMNALVLETDALKTGVQSSAHTAIHVATSNFQTELFLKIATYRHSPSKKRYSYSPASTRHTQVMYAIAFSAGLNCLQVD